MNADTLVLFPKQFDFPAVKIDDFLTQAAVYIIKILANTSSPTVPILEARDETNNSLLKLALLFDRTDVTIKKLPIQHKQTINIAQQKLVPLPTVTVPLVSPLINHPQEKTEKMSLPSSAIPKKHAPPIPVNWIILKTRLSL